MFQGNTHKETKTPLSNIEDSAAPDKVLELDIFQLNYKQNISVKSTLKSHLV